MNTPVNPQTKSLMPRGRVVMAVLNSWSPTIHIKLEKSCLLASTFSLVTSTYGGLVSTTSHLRLNADFFNLGNCECYPHPRVLWNRRYPSYLLRVIVLLLWLPSITCTEISIASRDIPYCFQDSVLNDLLLRLILLFPCWLIFFLIGGGGPIMGDLWALKGLIEEGTFFS